MDNGKKKVSTAYCNDTSFKDLTTGASSDPLRVSTIEDDPTTEVLPERTVHDDMSGVITEGASSIWTVVGHVTEVAAKRTKVSKTMVLGVSWGTLSAVGTFVIWAINMKMPEGVAVIIDSLMSCLHGWAQMGILRDNTSGVGGGMVLMKGRTRVSRGI